MEIWKMLKEGVADIFSGLKETVRLLGRGWKKLVRVLYGKVTDMPVDTQPTFFELLAAIHAVVAQMPVKKRWGVRIGSGVLALALVVGVGALAVGGNSGGGGGSNGGGVIHIGNREPYVPEFAKLDCLTCRGDGDCNTCGGYGEVRRYAGAGDTVRAKCSTCYGSGNCRTCGGSGKR